MLVTVDTEHIDLVHNTEVLEAALDELPAGWIVDLEFFKEGTFSFVKTYDAWFIASDDSFISEDTPDFVSTIQGHNHLKQEAMLGMSNPVWTSRLSQIAAVSLSRVLLAHF